MNHSKLCFLSFFLFSFFIWSSYSSNTTTTTRCSPIQTQALLLFKGNLFSRDDFNYDCYDWLGFDYHPIMTNWNARIDCCNWDGVTCSHSTGDVVALDLSCGMLQGTIHPNSTLFGLPHLETLNLAYNNLTNSQLPREIGRFSNSLTHLNISYSGFIGRVPTDITILRKLVSLDLSWNYLKLEPHVFYNLLHNSTNLEELFLGGVNISSILPGYLNISSSMKSLNLRYIGLLGTLPDNIFNLPYLEELDLSHNDDLTNQLPKVYINTSIPLKLLDLSYTNLFGEIPESIGHLESLTYFYLSNTNVSGEITGIISHLKSLTHLDLSHTNVSGEIPGSIGHLKSLTFLDLSNTNVSGEIPGSIGHLKSLSYLILPNTNVSGEIPGSIGHLKSLIALDVNSNLIQGSFPPSICNLSYLQYLDMSNNRLGGVIPQCLGNSSSLAMIDLGNNNFHGTIPNAWDDCGELEGLILNGNSLEGEVPNGLSKCKSLKVLDLGNNQLNGTFPHWSANLQLLQVLVLKSNKLHGPIQTSSIIQHPFSSLKVLDLSQNKFVGHLPGKYFQNFDAMKKVENYGATPQYLTLGKYLKYYSITVAVKGSELPFPKLSVDYTIVDLSSNIFDGEIPNVIGSLNSLIVLNLSHNNLNGPIPNALGNLLEIESLDLSHNRLNEKIPQSLAAITNLEALDLSQNHLVGRIPDGRQFKTFEATSFEGNPGLCGFPLPNCEHPSASQLEVDGDDESGFTWKVVMLGYGCGTLLGLVMGYIMLSTGRPKWFNAIADDIEHMILKRRKKTRYVYIGR